MKYCPNCGSRISEDNRFCDECGSNIKKPTRNENDKNQSNLFTDRLKQRKWPIFIFTLVVVGLSIYEPAIAALIAISGILIIFTGILSTVAIVLNIGRAFEKTAEQFQNLPGFNPNKKLLTAGSLAIYLLLIGSILTLSGAIVYDDPSIQSDNNQSGDLPANELTDRKADEVVLSINQLPVGWEVQSTEVWNDQARSRFPSATEYTELAFEKEGGSIISSPTRVLSKAGTYNSESDAESGYSQYVESISEQHATEPVDIGSEAIMYKPQDDIVVIVFRHDHIIGEIRYQSNSWEDIDEKAEEFAEMMAYTFL